MDINGIQINDDVWYNYNTIYYVIINENKVGSFILTFPIYFYKNHSFRLVFFHID